MVFLRFCFKKVENKMNLLAPHVFLMLATNKPFCRRNKLAICYQTFCPPDGVFLMIFLRFGIKNVEKTESTCATCIRNTCYKPNSLAEETVYISATVWFPDDVFLMVFLRFGFKKVENKTNLLEPHVFVIPATNQTTLLKKKTAICYRLAARSRFLNHFLKLWF